MAIAQAKYQKLRIFSYATKETLHLSIKKETGKSAQEYIQFKVIEQAKDFILKSNKAKQNNRTKIIAHLIIVEPNSS